MERYSSSSSSSEENGVEGGGVEQQHQSNKRLDLSYSDLDSESLEANLQKALSSSSAAEGVEPLKVLLLHHNRLKSVSGPASAFESLRKLDLSDNRLESLPGWLSRLPLRSLLLKNNWLGPAMADFLLGPGDKALDQTPLASSLEILNLSGNAFTAFPDQVLQLSKLRYLYLGQNRIETLPSQINRLNRLEILSVGGNRLTEVPQSVGELRELQALILSNNQLESLPASVARLKKLRTLQLHKNKLRTLPTDIVALKYLSELSLRDNPLVVKFVSDMVHKPSSLLELAGRCIKLHDVPYRPEDVPRSLADYLSSAHRCLNPKCKGMFFDSRVEHVKFVDFCGKYRLPLLQYLCSSSCIDDVGHLPPSRHSSRGGRTAAGGGGGGGNSDDMLRKVLLP